MNDFGLVLRSELYTSKEVLEFARLADDSEHISHLFFPDIPNRNESIELSTVSLALTKRMKVGTGVLRLAEYNPEHLARRLQTIQFLSGNRFVLGIGAGSPGPKPGQTIARMFSSLKKTKESFISSSYGAVKFPVVVAALKPLMTTKSIEHADGLLLNYCSPEYAEGLVNKLGLRQTCKSVACYIKIFFAGNRETADKLLIEEFARYDRFPEYHKMFENEGISDTITSAKERLSDGRTEVPERLKRISLSNPSADELSSLLVEFRRSGINLPCVLPYFTVGENSEFKRQAVNLLFESLSA